MIRVNDATYKDQDNPCESQFGPPRPAQPVGRWNRIADEGEAPWCMGTRYRFQYVRGGIIGDWSEYSEVFQSNTHTEPVLTLPPPFIDFDVNVHVSHVGFITLTCDELRSGSCLHPSLFAITTDQGVVSGLVDFRGFWPPGRLSVTLTVEDFIDKWNSLDADKRKGLGQLNLLASGKLQLEGIFTDGDPLPITNINASRNWEQMGFGKEGLFTNSPINAVNFPIAQAPNAQELVRGDGSGNESGEWIDEQNPCAAMAETPEQAQLLGWGQNC